ncbi:MAG: LysR family transcriptional regulator [Bacteriovoracaceae bacterium]|nr:LysR family transcriptional regulator [Bacteriovoracaceae bacterium]
MSIEKLKYYSVVVETKNLRKAAELLGITSGSLSKAVSTLEKELSVKLIRPEGRGIDITKEGLEVYKKSKKLLEEYHVFFHSIANDSIKPESEQLKMGSFEVFSSYFISKFLQKELPDLNLSLLELPPGKIEESVLNGSVDFGLTYLPVPNNKLSFIEVGEFEMSICGLPKWKNIDFKSWSFAVPTTPLLLHTSNFNSLDLWPNGVSRNIKYGFELLETALQTSQLGLSVIHCPKFIISLSNKYCKDEYQLEQLPYPKKMKKIKPSKIYLVLRKDHSIGINLEGKLAKFVRSLKVMMVG